MIDDPLDTPLRSSHPLDDGDFAVGRSITMSKGQDIRIPASLVGARFAFIGSFIGRYA